MGENEMTEQRIMEGLKVKKSSLQKLFWSIKECAPNFPYPGIARFCGKPLKAMSVTQKPEGEIQIQYTRMDGTSCFLVLHPDDKEEILFP
jgi:hypothetical protein